MLRVVVFASGKGSNLQNLIDVSKNSENLFKVVGVISNNKNSNALTISENEKIAGFNFTVMQFLNEEDFSNAILNELKKLNCDLIVLAGYMKKVPTKIISEYQNRIINIHPSLLPNFGGEGMFGEFVHKAVLESKNKVTGATVHFVNEDYDKGEIILQEEIPVLDNDTTESLAKRVLEVEHIILPKAVIMIANNKIKLK
ncbi:MAG: phosphoribosylglycinamide formyltransferase [Ignavibacteria bacterium]|nr:phosphoribosylglycinamide formyltransferase [Bacteroidota bacterium]MSQ45538.1 phosphoribosylglycinamide formyltransferase [Ignavibacteria bacterium]